MALDAAFASLAELRDPAKYECKLNVPIFRAHKRKKLASDGSMIDVEVSDADLNQIVDNMRAYMGEGGAARMVEGHVDPNPAVVESYQPELVGFAINPHIGYFGPQNVKAVMVDEYVKRSMLPVVKNRPFRSAEYYPAKKVIKGLAVLVRDADLNLGFVSYSARRAAAYTNVNGVLPAISADEPYVSYSMESTMPDPAAVGSPSGNPAAPPAAGQPTDPTYTPEEEANYSAMCANMAKDPKMCQFMMNHPKGMKMYMSGAGAAPTGPGSAAGAGNATNMPRENEMAMHAEHEKQMALYAERQAASDARIAALESGNAKLMLEAQRKDCERIVAALHVDYKLNPAIEVDRMVAMSAADREKHVQYVIDNYRPQDQQIQVYNEGRVEGGVGAAAAAAASAPTDAMMADIAVNYASENGLTYDAALVKCKEGARPKRMPLPKRARGADPRGLDQRWS